MFAKKLMCAGGKMWVNLTNCLQININNFANGRPLPGLIPGPIASQEVGRGLHVGIIDLFCLLFFYNVNKKFISSAAQPKIGFFARKKFPIQLFARYRSGSI